MFGLGCLSLGFLLKTLPSDELLLEGWWLLLIFGLL